MNKEEQIKELKERLESIKKTKSKTIAIAFAKRKEIERIEEELNKLENSK